MLAKKLRAWHRMRYLESSSGAFNSYSLISCRLVMSQSRSHLLIHLTVEHGERSFAYKWKI